MITAAAVSAAFVVAAPAAEATTVHAAKSWTLPGPAGTKAWGSATKWSDTSTLVTVNIKARGHGWNTILKLGSKHTITIPVGGTAHPRPVVVVGKTVKAQLCIHHRGLRDACTRERTIYKR